MPTQQRLHANATTTPKTRAYIQSSGAPVAELARELGISETTVRRWRVRQNQQDRPHRRHNLGQSTTPEDEVLIAELRQRAGLSLDDICEVMRRCVNPDLSRSAIYRALRRLGMAGRVTPPAPAKPERFEDTRFGFVHIDLKYLGKLKGRGEYAFVAIERVTRFVHVEVVQDRRMPTIAAALKRFLEAFAHPVHTILTDNGAEFTDRFAHGAHTGSAPRATGDHPFDII